jgi:hypothetical protein
VRIAVNKGRDSGRGRRAVPPPLPHAGSHNGDPKLVELSVQNPLSVPSSKLGSAIKLPLPVAALVVLLPATGSPCVASIVAVAFSVKQTELFSETVKRQDWLPPFAKVPKFHFTLPPTAVALQVLKTKLTSLGRVTVTIV